MSEPTQAATENATRNALAAEEAANTAEQKSFSPEYVRDLREEAARWRVQAQQFKEPWNGVSEDDQAVWREIITLTSKDPKAGAEYMARIAAALNPPPPQAPPAGQVRVPTEQDIQRLVDERVGQNQQQQLIREIEAEARALGYEPNTNDYIDLLWVAENETQADLNKAHEIIQERRSVWVDQEIERRMQEGRGWIRPVRGGAPAATSPKEIHTFEEAKAAMMARFDRI